MNMARKEKTVEELQEILDMIAYRSFDGKDRRVADSSEVMPDGEYWALVNDHGNVEIVHKGRNGHVYYHGGLV
jgi:hypothetical protein